MKAFLTGDENAPAHAQIALRLKTSPDAVKMAVSRLKQEYGRLLRTEINRTVSSPAEAEEELRHLMGVLAD